MTLLTVSPTQSQIQTALRNFLVAILPSGIPIVQGQANRVPEPKNSDFVLFTIIRRDRIETNIDSYADCAFTASIVGTVMSVTDIVLGTITIGNQVFGSGLATGTTTIVEQLSGSVGGTGTYSVSLSQNVVSQLLACGVKAVMQPTEIVFQLDVHGPASHDNAQIVSTLFRDSFATEFFEQSGIPVSPLFADDPKQIPYWNDQSQMEMRYVIEAHLQANQTVTVPQQFADSITVELINVDATYPA